jgi:hypothetical protein
MLNFDAMANKTNAARLPETGYIRGLQIKIAPQELIDFIGAGIYPI